MRREEGHADRLRIPVRECHRIATPNTAQPVRDVHDSADISDLRRPLCSDAHEVIGCRSREGYHPYPVVLGDRTDVVLLGLTPELSCKRAIIMSRKRAQRAAAYLSVACQLQRNVSRQARLIGLANPSLRLIRRQSWVP